MVFGLLIVQSITLIDFLGAQSLQSRGPDTSTLQYLLLRPLASVVLSQQVPLQAK